MELLPIKNLDAFALANSRVVKKTRKAKPQGKSGLQKWKIAEPPFFFKKNR